MTMQPRGQQQATGDNTVMFGTLETLEDLGAVVER